MLLFYAVKLSSPSIRLFKLLRNMYLISSIPIPCIICVFILERSSSNLQLQDNTVGSTTPSHIDTCTRTTPHPQHSTRVTMSLVPAPIATYNRINFSSTSLSSRLCVYIRDLTVKRVSADCPTSYYLAASTPLSSF